VPGSRDSRTMRCPVHGSIQSVGGSLAGEDAWTVDASFDPRVELVGFKSDLESIEPARGSSAASVENPMHQTRPQKMPQRIMSQRIGVIGNRMFQTVPFQVDLECGANSVSIYRSGATFQFRVQYDSRSRSMSSSNVTRKEAGVYPQIAQISTDGKRA
jgi:hypothetical protein